MRSRLILILTLLGLLSTDINAQVSVQVQQQRKTALVIGNGNYITSILPNPENDAKAMALILKSLGFEVYEYENLNLGQMKKAIDDFGFKLLNNDVGLFFYAGHGIQSKGYNYLIPVDANLQSEAQVEYDCVQADRVLAIMEESGAPVKIVILDACRNNPFERSWTRAASGRGLATMNAPGGTLIGYATSPGSTASDGSGKNGLYTSALLESIVIPGISISQMFQNVGRIVSQKSNKQQIPWISSSLIADYYFTNKENVISGNIDTATLTGLNRTIAPDKIYKLNGEILNVKIVKISPASVEYYLAGQEATIIQELKSNLFKVVYSSGLEELFTKTEYPKISSPDDWQLVLVTEDKTAISGLTEFRRLKASSFWGGTGGTNMGLNNCIRDLKRKAAKLGCPVVLVIDKKMGMTTSVEGIACK
jgi:hypothetical protein